MAKNEGACLYMGKKKKPLPPRRLRMKREGRLSSAKVWLADFIEGYTDDGLWVLS
ncbi:hypothetical protein AB4Z22_39060 [Paenibacillus sp. TAF58]